MWPLLGAYHIPAPIILKPGSINLLQPSGPVQGLLYLYLYSVPTLPPPLLLLIVVAVLLQILLIILCNTLTGRNKVHMNQSPSEPI